MTVRYFKDHRPKSGETTFHRNGDVTFWNVYTQQWTRYSPEDWEPGSFASLSDEEKERVNSILEQHAPWLL